MRNSKNKYAMRAIMLEELLVLSKYLNNNEFVTVFQNLILHRIERLGYKPQSVKKQYNVIYAILSDIGKQNLIDKFPIPNQSDVDIDKENNAEELELIQSYLKNSKTNLMSKIEFTKYVDNKYKGQIVILEAPYTLGLDTRCKAHNINTKKTFWTTRRVLTNLKTIGKYIPDALAENRLSADKNYSGINAF
jgi:hypothetical protein